MHGGTVERAEQREYGKAEITIKAVDPYGNEYVARSSEIIPSNDWNFAQQ